MYKILKYNDCSPIKNSKRKNMNDQYYLKYELNSSPQEFHNSRVRTFH